MPRHPTTTDESLELVKPPAKESNAEEISEKLDVLIMHIARMDQRDKIRMWGSFFRAMLGIIPMLFFLWSIWYFATHTDEIIRKVSEESARAAAQYTGEKSGELMQQLQDLMPKR